MSIVEPPAALDVVEQREPQVVSAPAETSPAVEKLDHVRSHSVKCYWDYRECRWECSAD